MVGELNKIFAVRAVELIDHIRDLPVHIPVRRVERHDGLSCMRILISLRKVHDHERLLICFPELVILIY